MLGTARLLTFLFRALVLLIAVSILWVNVAEQYNGVLVSLADRLLPDEISVRALGSHLVFRELELGSSVSIDGLTLHYGLILLVVLVLASVGLGVISRAKWLLILGAGSLALHVVGVALLGRGLAWAASARSPEGAGEIVYSLFAVFWGLLPAVIGGLWCYMYWIPRASDKMTRETRREPGATDTPLTSR